MVFVVCWSFGFVNRLYCIFFGHLSYLMAANVFFGGLQGFFNAIIYGTNENVKKKLKKIVKKYCFAHPKRIVVDQKTTLQGRPCSRSNLETFIQDPLLDGNESEDSFNASINNQSSKIDPPILFKSHFVQENVIKEENQDEKRKIFQSLSI